MLIDERLLAGLSDDVRERVDACESLEDLEALIASERKRLTPEQLDAVSGGCGSCSENCRCIMEECDWDLQVDRSHIMD